MKIEELSIGDWVCAKLAKWESDDADTTPPLQVKRIDSIERHNLYVDLFNPATNTIEHSAFVGDLVPIPITPEILEKNGFERAQYTIDIADEQEIEYDGYRHILCQDVVQYDIILTDSFGGYFDLEIESSHRDEDGDRILISSKLSLDYVEFVHQLQHLLRLAGVGKEMVL